MAKPIAKWHNRDNKYIFILGELSNEKHIREMPIRLVTYQKVKNRYGA